MEREERAGSVTPETSSRSFTDVVSDLEAHRARELSLSLQNHRLRSVISRQSSLDQHHDGGAISPRQNADCNVRLLSIGGALQVRCLSLSLSSSPTGSESLSSLPRSRAN